MAFLACFQKSEQHEEILQRLSFLTRSQRYSIYFLKNGCSCIPLPLSFLLYLVIMQVCFSRTMVNPPWGLAWTLCARVTNWVSAIVISQNLSWHECILDLFASNETQAELSFGCETSLHLQELLGKEWPLKLLCWICHVCVIYSLVNSLAGTAAWKWSDFIGNTMAIFLTVKEFFYRDVFYGLMVARELPYLTASPLFLLSPHPWVRCNNPTPVFCAWNCNEEQMWDWNALTSSLTYDDWSRGGL